MVIAIAFKGLLQKPHCAAHFLAFNPRFRRLDDFFACFLFVVLIFNSLFPFRFATGEFPSLGFLFSCNPFSKFAYEKKKKKTKNNREKVFDIPKLAPKNLHISFPLKDNTLQQQTLILIRLPMAME